MDKQFSLAADAAIHAASSASIFRQTAVWLPQIQQQRRYKFRVSSFNSKG